MSSVSAIAQSGIAAATLRLNVSASNIANADDASAVGATGYQPLGVVESAAPGGGVTAKAVTLPAGGSVVYDPTSAVADAGGMVQMPNVDPITEISNVLAAGQAFAFSVKVMKAANQDEQTLLDLKT